MKDKNVILNETKHSNYEDLVIDFDDSNSILVLFDKFNKCRTSVEINGLLFDLLNKPCMIVESDVLVFDSNLPVFDIKRDEKQNSSDLINRIEYLIEEGIIDWAIQGCEPQLIMDLQSQLRGNQQNILFLPMLINNEPLGIFVAFTERAKEDFDEILLNYLRVIAGFAASRIDVILRSKQAILLEQRYSEINERFMNILPLTSFGEISLTVLKEVSLPLQIIDSNVNLIESGVGNLERRLEIIKQQIKSISEIISLLDDISTDAKNPEPEIINVDEMITETISILSTQTKSRGISIKVQFDTEPHFVKGIKSQLEFVLIQIINFLSDNPNESETIYLSITKPNNRTLLLAIKDEAKGYEHDTFDEMLELLKSRSSMMNYYQSFQSIKNILKINKARIESLSRINDGTIFRIFLPYLDNLKVELKD